MRDHTLLQAIARVNRPYEEEGLIKKPSGFVLDFVGIFEKLEKALAFDSDVVGSVIQDLDVLKHRFSVLMTDQAPEYLSLCEGHIDDKAVERAIDAFVDKEKRDRFYKFFKEIETLYEIISPDVFLREHLDNYGKLSVLYEIVRNNFTKRVALSKELARKTQELIRDYAKAYGLETTMPIVEIDEKTLDALRKSGLSDPAKVINLGKSLAKKVIEEAERAPYLIPIGERCEAILYSYDDRQMTTQEAFERIKRLMEQYIEAHKEREKSGFDNNTFAIYLVLKQFGTSQPEEVAPLVNSAFQRFPNYRYNTSEQRHLKAELYKVLLRAVGKERMVDLADQLLGLPRT